MVEQPSAVTAIKFGPAARTLAVGGTDGSVYLWRGDDRRAPRGLRAFAHVGHVTDIAFSPTSDAARDGQRRRHRPGVARQQRGAGERPAGSRELRRRRRVQPERELRRHGRTRRNSSSAGGPKAARGSRRCADTARKFERPRSCRVDGAWSAPVKTARSGSGTASGGRRFASSARFRQPVTRVAFAGDALEAVTNDGRLARGVAGRRGAGDRRRLRAGARARSGRLDAPHRGEDGGRRPTRRAGGRAQRS